MKTKFIWITGTFMGLLLLLLLYSYCVAPLSVDHGTNVSLAKYIAQGITPYQELKLTEPPLGIGILSLLYRVVGSEASGYWASGLMFIVHLLNMGLLAKAMRRIHLKGAAIFGGLSFYLLMVYSSDALMLRMETFATCFLLLSFLLILKKKKSACVYAAICFVLAIECKAQCIVMLPILAIPVLWQGKRSRFCGEKGGLFCAVTITLAVIAYIGIAWASGNSQWIQDIGWKQIETNPFKTPHDILHDKLVYVAIQAGRCSLFLFLLFPFVWKQLNGYGKRAFFMGIGAFIMCSALFYWRIEVPFFMFAYPFIAIALAHIMQHIGSVVKAGIIWIAVLLIPGALTVRECKKLENGTVKAEQQEEISALKEIIKRPGRALVLFKECYEFDLGPQIFSELPQIRPIDMKSSKLGMENTDQEHDILLQQIAEADYVILNEEGFSTLSYSNASDRFFEVIGEMKSYGTGKLTIYAKR